jgi:lysophospholipase L1-like esterase
VTLRALLVRLVALALAAALVAGSAELTLWAFDVGADGVDQRHGWTVRFDPVLLFRLKPRSRPDINRHGFRDRPFDAKVAGRVRVLALGDSFSMGWNVAPEETLPRRLEAHLGGRTEVLNLGVLGYGPDQSLLVLRGLRRELAPDAVVLNLYAGNDFEDLHKNRLFTVGPDGRLSARPTNPVAELLPPSRAQIFWGTRVTGSLLRELTRPALMQRLFGDVETELGPPEDPASRERRVLMSGVLEAFANELGGAGVPLLVSVLPSVCAVVDRPDCRPDTRIPPGSSVNEAALVQICEALDLPCVDVSRAFLAHPGDRRTLYSRGDWHFSPAGNDLAARAIAQALASEHGTALGWTAPP